MARAKTTMQLDLDLADYAVKVLEVPNRTEAVEVALRQAVARAARDELRKLNASAEPTPAELDTMREDGWR